MQAYALEYAHTTCEVDITSSLAAEVNVLMSAINVKLRRLLRLIVVLTNFQVHVSAICTSFSLLLEDAILHTQTSRVERSDLPPSIKTIDEELWCQRSSSHLPSLLAHDVQVFAKWSSLLAKGNEPWT